MKIALIGATGFVGSAILKEALDRGHEVAAIVRHTEKLQPHPKLHSQKGDIYNASATRSPFPGWIPRSLKRKSGRKGMPLVPAHIRMLGTVLSKEERTSIRQKLRMKLGKFAGSIERVSIRVKDVNGPRGGIDHVCRIKVVLNGLPSVVYEAQDASLNAAIGRALAGTERAVRRSLQRRRMKPIKVGARSRARLS
jgi:ribosome-associated translation inhibitor RaiA